MPTLPPVDERAVQVLERHGWKPGDVLSTGVEGTAMDLQDLLRFGTALRRAPIPFRTSRVIEILEADGVTITIEAKVNGRPLRLDSSPDAPVVSDREARLMGDALAGLARATTAGLDVLPLLPGEPPATGTRFPIALAELVERRFAAHPNRLRQEVAGVDDLVLSLSRWLRNRPDSPPPCLLHGDLIPANVLVENGAVAGVVDFGFLTTMGDPQFDAAITASIFDMYGPHARASESLLTDAFCARFRDDPQTYLRYRAAYAVITNSYFDPAGVEGHFHWCVSMLRREEIRRAVHGDDRRS